MLSVVYRLWAGTRLWEVLRWQNLGPPGGLWLPAGPRGVGRRGSHPSAA